MCITCGHQAKQRGPSSALRKLRAEAKQDLVLNTPDIIEPPKKKQQKQKQKQQPRR